MPQSHSKRFSILEGQQFCAKRELEFYRSELQARSMIM
jgi:hypothetical protein